MVCFLSLGVCLCIVSVCIGCDGCCHFCVISDACNLRCSWSCSILVSSCRCCVFVSCVHPAAVCSYVWRMQEVTIWMRHAQALVARLPHAVAFSVFNDLK